MDENLEVKVLAYGTSEFLENVLAGLDRIYTVKTERATGYLTSIRLLNQKPSVYVIDYTTDRGSPTTHVRSRDTHVIYIAESSDDASLVQNHYLVDEVYSLGTHDPVYVANRIDEILEDKERKLQPRTGKTTMEHIGKIIASFCERLKKSTPH